MDNGEGMSLEVVLKKSDDEAPILELTGRIIDVDVKKFQRRIEQFYKKKCERIIVDVSRANFIDSHGSGNDCVLSHVDAERKTGTADSQYKLRS